MSSSMRREWSAVLCDSLAKVFPDERPRELTESIPLVGLRGEVVSFQVAVLPPYLSNAVRLGGVRVELSLPAGLDADVSSVELVPVSLPAFEDADDHYLRTAPGLFPDLLRPVDDATIAPVPGQWRAAWVDLRIGRMTAPGTHEVGVRAIAEHTGEEISRWELTLHVPEFELPPLDIPHTEWFHCDALADYYGYEVFGEEHWSSIDSFLGSAARAGINSVLTPVWTPPLDTEIGGARTPTQLVRIRDDGDEQYEFDFTLLRRWMALCRKHDMRYLEIPHLFSQWGAKATPAIYVSSGEQEERRFGWHVEATDPRYRAFLEQFLPALLDVLDSEWERQNVFFHISDEPTHEQVQTYSAARSVVADLLEGRQIIDAISDLPLYESGLVPIPVVAADHASAFHEARVDPMWLYYCVAQNRFVANRFIALPSTRSRVLGAQLFCTRASGFLHWGFNFYNSSLSRRRIDPFQDTCAGASFPGGDPFLVYPGPEGTPWESIRHRVVAEAFLDHRLLQAVRDSHGMDAARRLADQAGTLTMTEYSYDADDYRRLLVRAAQLMDEEPASAHRSG